MTITGTNGDPNIHHMVFGLEAGCPNTVSDKVAVVNTSQVYIIYYTPFPCMFREVEALYQAMAGYAMEKHLGGATKPLAKYGPHSVFYVVCHGNTYGDEVNCDCKTCGALAPGQLWYRLKEDGLPQNPTAVRLWACLGADSPSGNPQGMSFAANLALAANGDNYDKSFLTERTTFQSFTGYLTMTKDGGYSYTERGNDSTRVKAMSRLVNVKRPA